MTRNHRSRDRVLFVPIALVLMVLVISSCDSDSIPPPATVEEVRLLAWIGYQEEDLLQVIKRETRLKVSVKTFIGGSEMLSLLESDPSSYDVAVLDPEYIGAAHKRSLLEPLDPGDFDLEQYHPFFRNLERICVKLDGDLFAVPVRFGIIGVLYNADRVPDADMKTYDSLFKPEYRNRISVMDLWQPIMGVLSISLGHAKDPYDLTASEFAELKERLMALKAHGVRVHASVPDMITSLSTETTWIMLGGGEANAASLREKGKQFKWTVPQAGGILWMESLGVVCGTPNKAAATRLIKFLHSPKGQALLARRKTYISSPPSMAALKFLTPEERQLRRVSDPQAMTELLSRVVVRTLPAEQMLKTWIDAWEEFKQ